MGSWLKSVMPKAGVASTRKNDSIETPAMTPFGSDSPSSLTPNSGLKSVL